MKKSSTNTKIIFFIMFVALCFYTVRLRYTTEIASDFGRDTLRSLELWQNKQFTFLGSPLALDSLPGKTVFFTSLSLYIGMIGLLVSGFSPIGPVIPNILLTVLSINVFYLLALRLLGKNVYALFATFVYALTPLTVHYSRIFWTPSTLIPLSVFFWYLATGKNNWGRVIAGVAAGVMFLVHYMAIVPIIIYLFVLLLKKEFRQMLPVATGLAIGVAPFLLFELRNHFFLTTSLVANIMAGSANTGTVDSGSLLYRLTPFLGSLFGLRSAELSYPDVFGEASLVRAGFLFLTIVLMLRELVAWRDKERLTLAITIMLSFMWVLFTRNSINIRYLFSLYAILVLFGASMLLRTRSRLLILIFTSTMLTTSLMLVNRTVTMTNYSVPIATLERAGAIIAQDDFKGAYNITETVTGDAKATALRFFVMRDAVHRPLGPGAYEHLDGLYVMASRDSEALDSMRWEFLVNPTLQLETKWPAGEVYVYKFLRH